MVESPYGVLGELSLPTPYLRVFKKERDLERHQPLGVAFSDLYRSTIHHYHIDRCELGSDTPQRLGLGCVARPPKPLAASSVNSEKRVNRDILLT